MEMVVLMLSSLQVKQDILCDEKYKYIFSVEMLNELVLQGLPFRSAYQQVAKEIERGTFRFEGQLSHTHEGSIGNLCNEDIVSAFNKVAQRIS